MGKDVGPRAGATRDGRIAPDLREIGDDLVFQIHITRRALTQWLRRQRSDKAPRAPSGFYATLILVGANPGISQSEIADALFLDMPNLVVILNRLEAEALVTREPDPGDRRRLLLNLTALGQQRCDAAIAISRNVTNSLAAGLDPGEAEQLRVLLGKLQQSLRGSRAR